MESLLTFPGTVRHEPFHFFDSQKMPARCNLLLHPKFHWAIVTERPDAIGEGLYRSACVVAEAICTKFNLNPLRLVLLANYPFKGGRNVYSMHFMGAQRDMFDGLVFHQATRNHIQDMDLKDVVAMLKAGNQQPSVLRAIQPPLPVNGAAASTGRRGV